MSTIILHWNWLWKSDFDNWFKSQWKLDQKTFFYVELIFEQESTQTPSQSAPTIVIHQVGLIFLRVWNFLKKVQNMGCKKQGAKKTDWLGDGLIQDFEWRF